MQKRKLNEFALMGGQKAFAENLPVGQLYFPDWEEYEVCMRDIFDRQYYTNHGKLAAEFEESIARRLGVKHVICVTNATIALLMAVKALELSGSVIVPSFTFIASVQSLTWTGITPVFCDADIETAQMSLSHVAELLEGDVSAVMGVNLWGGACAPQRLVELAGKNGVPVYFDSAHAFGCELDGAPVGGFGELEIFSFHATKVMGTGEGGCITTNDDRIAARLRNIRSSYGAGARVDVPVTSNGRMSEAQAAIGLLNLKYFDAYVRNNIDQFAAYRTGLHGIPGIRLREPLGVVRSNYQYLVCEVEEKHFGMSRDGLLRVLKAENVNARRYFYPGVHRCPPYSLESRFARIALPGADYLSGCLAQLPIGARVDMQKIERICELVADAQRHAEDLKTAAESGS